MSKRKNYFWKNDRIHDGLFIHHIYYKYNPTDNDEKDHIIHSEIIYKNFWLVNGYDKFIKYMHKMERIEKIKRLIDE